MKLKIRSNSFDTQLTNETGEIIYNYQAESLNVEIDITKLINSLETIQQVFTNSLKKTATKSTPSAQQNA